MQDFFALFFEFFGTAKSVAADQLYEFVYVPAAFIWLFGTFLGVVLYYQGFFIWQRKARFDTRIHWFVWMLLNSVMIMLLIWLLTDSILRAEDLEYGVTEYLEFLCMALLWSLILFFLFSLVVKFTNPSRRKIPF